MNITQKSTKTSISAGIALVLLIIVLILTLGACQKKAATPADLAKSVWQDSFADMSAFTEPSTVTAFTAYINREAVEGKPSEVGNNDVKYLLDNGTQARYINVNDGYAITLPSNDFDLDLSYSALRTKAINDDCVITISRENKSPYGNTEDGWDTYFTECLDRYISDERFLRYNGLEYTLEPTVLTDMISGYSVYLYGIYIADSENIALPYYNLAFVRADGVYNDFVMVVQKSASDTTESFADMVASIREFEPSGLAQNDTTPFEVVIPEEWDEATKKYYDKLTNQTTIDWGFFTDSMPPEDENSWSNVKNTLPANQAELEELFDTTFEVLPTYLHLGWESKLLEFPVTLSAEHAGGDGFNGKPVLQMSYQFTTRNNTQLNRYTPMFEIMNGKYDDHFRYIAQAIKDYGYPVLFRLNNEMDTDWTSYCGMVTLLDPDIFIATWERMYNVFKEEGVTNCIWIFNPFDRSYPISNWGQWLNYLPDISMVHMLGVTGYEFANGLTLDSTFSARYRALYERSIPYFINFPWSISEFACGAGGEVKYDYATESYKDTDLGRNEMEQSDWVRAMFSAFNNNQDENNAYVRNIKVAIWFNCNDVAEIDGKTYITNYLKVSDKLPQTIEQFKIGFQAKNK